MGEVPKLRRGRKWSDGRDALLPQWALTVEFMRAAKRPRMGRIVRLQAIEWSGMRRLMRSGLERGSVSRDGPKTAAMPEISAGPLH